VLKFPIRVAKDCPLPVLVYAHNKQPPFTPTSLPAVYPNSPSVYSTPPTGLLNKIKSIEKVVRSSFRSSFFSRPVSSSPLQQVASQAPCFKLSAWITCITKKRMTGDRETLITRQEM